MGTQAPESLSTRICAETDLEENWGEVALVEGHQYAIFKTKHGYYACDHLDPNSGALVIARGIVGEKDGHPTHHLPSVLKRCMTSPPVNVYRVLITRLACTP